MKKELNEILNEPDLSIPRVQGNWKYILLPLMIIWFLLQLAFFTGLWMCFGWISFFMILISLFEKHNDSLYLGIETLLMPFVAPVIWWIRYFKFGEYNPLIGEG